MQSSTTNQRNSKDHIQTNQTTALIVETIDIYEITFHN